MPRFYTQATVVQSLPYKPTCMTVNLGFIAVGGQRGELNVVTLTGTQLFDGPLGGSATNGKCRGLQAHQSTSLLWHHVFLFPGGIITLCFCSLGLLEAVCIGKCISGETILLASCNDSTIKARVLRLSMVPTLLPSEGETLTNHCAYRAADTFASVDGTAGDSGAASASELLVVGTDRMHASVYLRKPPNLPPSYLPTCTSQSPCGSCIACVGDCDDMYIFRYGALLQCITVPGACVEIQASSLHIWPILIPVAGTGRGAGRRKRA